jgi:hypothetical protein
MEENDEGRSGDGDDSSDRHGCVSIFMVIVALIVIGTLSVGVGGVVVVKAREGRTSTSIKYLYHLLVPLKYLSLVLT